jgi:hypothetical protein
MMFQRAPPEVNGFGVMTSIPALTRSSQPRIFFGFPSRTTNTTTESWIMPPHRARFQLFGTFPALTRRSTSGSSESATTSAGRPAMTARVCSPELPYDWLKEALRPAFVESLKASMIFAYASFGVEYATRLTLVFSEAALAGRPTTAATRTAVPTTGNTKAKQIRRIRVTYLSTLSTKMVENTGGVGRRQVDSAAETRLLSASARARTARR